MSISDKLAVVKAVTTSKAGLELLKHHKNTPTVLFGLGVVGVVAAGVLACRATLHLEEDVIVPNEDDQEELQELLDKNAISPQVYTKERARLKVKLVGNVAWKYTPAIVVGGVGIAALTGSHVMLTRRNASLVAAYATIMKSYDEYRQRVRDEFGEEKDRELRFGVEEVEVADPDNPGKTKVVKKAKYAPDYARVFSRDTSESWDPRPEHNLVFLKSVQQWCTDTLRANKILTLNEVYDALGLSRTTAGAEVGWRYNNPRHNGDNRVDFSLLENATPDEINEFFHGPDGAIMLDFNVDGSVIDGYDEI